MALAENDDEPMLHYYMYFCTGNGEELKKAEQASPLYCFPNRLEDIDVLKKAVDAGGSRAAYYLGNLFYDKGRWQESVRLWEGCAEKADIPTVYRNLSLAYYNKLHDGERAEQAMKKAFSLDTTDARVFFELDQLYKSLNRSVEERLENMNAHSELLEKRDDLYTEYITLLNLHGDHEDAYRRIMSHNFHPWEGGEGKIPAQYRISLINLAKRADSREKAVALLESALVYPHNLGEGKLAGAMDNDIYYMLGELYEDKDDSENAYRLAMRGQNELGSAMYYNDQPPEMTFYAAKAAKALGNDEQAERMFNMFIDYANEHMNDDIKIDYFAVSLPDFLIFEADLNKKNRVHCCFMAALGYKGLGDDESAAKYAVMGLKEDKCHAGLNDLQKNG